MVYNSIKYRQWYENNRERKIQQTREYRLNKKQATEQQATEQQPTEQPPDYVFNKSVLQRNKKLLKEVNNNQPLQLTINTEKKQIIIQEMKHHLNILQQKITENINIFNNKGEIMDTINKFNIIVNNELNEGGGYLNQFKRY